MQGVSPRKGAPVNRSLAYAIAAALLAPALASPAWSTDLPTFDPHRLSQEVRTLSSDAFEGRGPATPGETKTVDYVVAQFKAAGLQPGGAIDFHNAEAGAAWLQRFTKAFPHYLWLNPQPEHLWEYRQSIAIIRQQMNNRMVPLTLDGLERGMRLLNK